MPTVSLCTSSCPPSPSSHSLSSSPRGPVVASAVHCCCSRFGNHPGAVPPPKCSRSAPRRTRPLPQPCVLPISRPALDLRIRYQNRDQSPGSTPSKLEDQYLTNCNQVKYPMSEALLSRYQLAKMSKCYH